MIRRASILIVVLFVMVVLSLTALSVTYRVGLTIRDSRGQATDARLKAYARSAIAIRMGLLADDDGAFDHPGEAWAATVELAETDWFPALRDDDGSRAVRVDSWSVDESSRLHVSAASTEALEAIGLDQREIDALLDWIDRDEVPRAYGAESAEYSGLAIPFRSKNAPLETLDELSLVVGAPWGVPTDGVTLLTVLGDGRVNVNTAPERVLRALPISSDAVSRIVGFRQMGEATRGDVSEYSLRTFDDLRRLQGLSATDVDILETVGRFNSVLFRIGAEVTQGDRRVRVLTLVARGEDGLEVLQWW
ncbi:MAG: hypothetical protein AAGG07_05935 [Planctomycetota bacterium]